jgi:cell division protein FtsA
MPGLLDRLPLLRRRAVKTPEYFTALDIGTENIKALVIKRPQGAYSGGPGLVCGVGRCHQGMSDMEGGAVSDIEAVIANCNRALEDAEEMAGVAPAATVIGIAGELVQGVTSTFNRVRENPELRINEVELGRLVEMVQRRALREALYRIAHETGLGDVKVKLINSAVVGVKLDGHVVNNPLGFQGTNLQVTVFNTFAPLTHIGALETIAAHLDLDVLATVAEPYAVARCICGDDSYEFGGIFIDIGGGTTDVALVRGGGIEGTRMFGLAGRQFTKRIAASLDVPLQEAEHLKLDHSAGRLDFGTDQRIHRPLQGDAEILATAVGLMLGELAKDDPLPPAIYLCGGGAALPELQEALREEEWRRELPLSRPPSVSLLHPSQVHDLEDTTGLLTSQQDITPMSLAYHGLSRSGEEEADDPQSLVMRKLLRAMKV